MAIVESRVREDDAYLLHLRHRCVASRRRNAIPLVDGDASSFPRRLAGPPTAQEFQRLVDEHVPLIISDVLPGRVRLWSDWQRTSYLVDRMGDSRIVVALTPDGRADDLVSRPSKGAPPRSRVFALPHDAQVTFEQLVRQLDLQSRDPPDSTGSCGCVAYLQSQNSNLDTAGPLSGDLAPLFQDLCERSDGKGRPDIAWATEAMGKPPEATNIWVGTSSSKTSMHRDHYENLFTVVRGCKVFTVFPPNEGRFLCDDEEFDAYRYQPASDSATGPSGLPTSFELRKDPETPMTRWIPIDPTLPKSAPRNQRYVHRDLNLDEQRDAPAASTDRGRPLSEDMAEPALQRYGYALPPLTIRVQAGETLYLPSGWYHHVAQTEDGRVETSAASAETGLCLCLNWWYEISDEMAIQLADLDDGAGDLDFT